MNRSDAPFVRHASTGPCCDLFSQLHPLLVTAVVSSRPATIFRWDRNVAALSAWASAASVQVDFFLIAFDNNASAWKDLKRPATGLLRIVDASLEKRFHPKQYLQAIHLRHSGLAAQHRFLWFLDEDIDVYTEGFDLGDFFRRFACGFMEGAPIIAQAQISPDTQAFHILNHATFLREVHKLFGTDAPIPLITQSEYVEYQTPLVDARFWLFFMDKVGATAAALDDIQETDWGIDALWCGAAAYYVNTRMSGRSAERRPCALIPLPLRHSQTSTIAHSSRYVKGGYAVRHWLTRNHIALLQAGGEPVNKSWDLGWQAFRRYKIQSGSSQRHHLLQQLFSNSSARFNFGLQSCLGKNV